MLDAAFGDDAEERFTDDDWDHAVGGVHFVLDVEGEIVTHASVVERDLHVGDRAVRTAYVEAMGTAPAQQGAGFGSMVMREVTAYIADRFELGALGTGRHAFYGRFGWQTWRGQTSVRTADGPRRTPEDDGFILVLLTAASMDLDLGATISCEWRPGEVW